MTTAEGMSPAERAVNLNYIDSKKIFLIKRIFSIVYMFLL